MGLASAGAVGLTTPEVRALLQEQGFGGVRTTTVRDALVRAGVASYHDGRWTGLVIR